ncbi:MAG TPA: translation initiation factor IF-3 [Thermoanaerobaculia bacterium]|nr:translation initiation factor IF-3 [Thermoanaerobaculia bacterium]
MSIDPPRRGTLPTTTEQGSGPAPRAPAPPGHPWCARVRACEPSSGRSVGPLPTNPRSGAIPTPVTNEPRINDRIRAREVRLVSAEGEQVGIKPLPEALAIARAADLDLVEVAPQASPPVCRIMDYGKFKYEAAQRAKESRRKTTQISIKEMKYRVKIGRGDFETKTKKVEHFLGEGHKVKITIMFRGREVAHPELGMKILDDVADHAKDLAKVEAAARLDGRNMTMVLAPDKRVQDAARRRAAMEGQSRSETETETSTEASTEASTEGSPETNGLTNDGTQPAAPVNAETTDAETTPVPTPPIEAAPLETMATADSVAAAPVPETTQGADIGAEDT